MKSAREAVDRGVHAESKDSGQETGARENPGQPSQDSKDMDIKKKGLATVRPIGAYKAPTWSASELR